MVKIYTKDGREEKFDTNYVEDELKKAGLPELVAKEVAERVEARVEDKWTTLQVKEQVDIELKRLEEDIQRAHNAFRAKTNAVETSRNETTTSQTFVPEKEVHERKHSIL